MLRVICAWCDKPLGQGEPGAPASHGICAACAGQTGVFPVEELLSMTAEEFDRLPIGIVQVDRDGVILSYNRAEERIAGTDRSRLVGKNFFTEVAPCTQVQDFHGRYREMTRREEACEDEFEFVFRFRSGERLVMIQLMYDPRRARGIVAVKALA